MLVNSVEYSKQYSYKLTTDSALYPFPLTKQTSSKSLPKIVYGQVYVSFTIDNTVSMVTYPIRRNKLLKMHDRRSQNNLYGVIRSITWNRH